MAKQVIYTTLEVCGTVRNCDGLHTYTKDGVRYDRIGIDMWIAVTEEE